MERAKFKFDRFFGFLGALAGLVLIQACTAPLPEEESCGFVRNSQAQRVSWANTTPVELYLDSSVPYEYYDSIDSAAKRWNDLAGRTLLQIRRGSNPGASEPTRDGFNKIYFMENWDPDRPRTEQGRTTIYWAGPKLFEADIRINGEHFRYFLAESERTHSAVHFESLIVHELGHVLGLSHNEIEGSVMQTALGYGQVRAEIGEADQASLACEY